MRNGSILPGGTPLNRFCRTGGNRTACTGPGCIRRRVRFSLLDIAPVAVPATTGSTLNLRTISMARVVMEPEQLPVSLHGVFWTSRQQQERLEDAAHGWYAAMAANAGFLGGCLLYTSDAADE